MKRVLLLDLPLLAILSILAHSIAYFQIDLYITQTLQLVNSAWFGGLMKLLSFIGDPIRFFPLVILIGLAFLAYRKKYTLLIYFSFFGIVTLGQILKTLTSRVRPDPLLIHQYLPQLAKDSFPSGHVLEYIGLLGALMIILRKEIKDNNLRIVLQALFVVLVVLIGISRIYLGEHWFSDVLGSFLLGIAWLYVLIWFNETGLRSF